MGEVLLSNVFNLNKLIKSPQDVIYSIISYDLCHLKTKEHPHRYWDLVRKYVPGYQGKKDWLRANAGMFVKLF